MRAVDERGDEAVAAEALGDLEEGEAVGADLERAGFPAGAKRGAPATEGFAGLGVGEHGGIVALLREEEAAELEQAEMGRDDQRAFACRILRCPQVVVAFNLRR